MYGGLFGCRRVGASLPRLLADGDRRGDLRTADWDTCAECADFDIPTGYYFANVGYTSCPDWVVNAAYEEAAEGGQCVEGLGGVHATSDECFDCRFCFDCEAYGTCDLSVEEKCW